MTWPAAFDALRIARPDLAEQLQTTFPEFSDEIGGRRTFGKAEARNLAERVALSRAAIEAVLAAVTASLEEVLAVVRKKATRLARSRLTSSLVTLIGSSGVIAAIPLGRQTAFASAAIAFVASAVTLMITYVEDSSGGEGSVSRLREEMIVQIGPLAEVRGRLALGLVAQKDHDLIAIMTILNAVAAKVLVARGRLNMSLPRSSARPISGV
jgi:hypothetical protein